MNCATVVLASALIAMPVHAQTDPDDHGAHHSQPSVAAPTMVEGEVRKVDKEAGKLTLKHAPIPNLEMPGMTMVFRVEDPAMLDKVKAGDKVRFAAEKVGGQLTVFELELAK